MMRNFSMEYCKLFDYLTFSKIIAEELFRDVENHRTNSFDDRYYHKCNHKQLLNCHFVEQHLPDSKQYY